MFVSTLVLALGQGVAAIADEPNAQVALRESGDGAFVVEVRGLSDQELKAIEEASAEARRELFSLAVDSAEGDLPPLDGRLSVVEDVARFTPRYPLEPGLSYRARFAPRKLEQVVEVPSKERVPTTVVTQIYPSADVLPENQLKFYIHFSAPMSRGEAYRHVHLLDDRDQKVEGAFLELGEELWDADHQRFTLLFDPGRIKRGLKPREELGPAIVAGREYTLVIRGDWRDATRTPLNSGARKHFSVGPPDERPIDAADWQITPPEADSHDLLLVRFGEPLDHSLLERVVSVQTADGKPVSGTIATGDNECCWQFHPDEAWPAGRYKLVADTRLEDLAGNAIGRPFEVDQFDQVDESIETEKIEIPFEVKAR